MEVDSKFKFQVQCIQVTISASSEYLWKQEVQLRRVSSHNAHPGGNPSHSPQTSVLVPLLKTLKLGQRHKANLPLEIFFSHTPSHPDVSQAIVWDKSVMEWAIGREGGRQRIFDSSHRCCKDFYLPLIF